MDWDRISGNWKQLTGKLREQWGKLTDDDIEQAAATGTSSKARSRRVMVTQKTRHAGKWTTG